MAANAETRTWLRSCSLCFCDHVCLGTCKVLGVLRRPTREVAVTGGVVGSDPNGPRVEEVGIEWGREQCGPEDSAGSVRMGETPETAESLPAELEAVDGHLFAVGYTQFCRQRKVTWCVREKD